MASSETVGDVPSLACSRRNLVGILRSIPRRVLACVAKAAGGTARVVVVDSPVQPSADTDPNTSHTALDVRQNCCSKRGRYLVDVVTECYSLGMQPARAWASKRRANIQRAGGLLCFVPRVHRNRHRAVALVALGCKFGSSGPLVRFGAGVDFPAFFLRSWLS